MFTFLLAIRSNRPVVCLYFIGINVIPAVFVIGSYSLIQHSFNGSCPWFWCACSDYTEKPEEAIWRPLWTMVQRPANTALWRGFYFIQSL